jgi:hypothetical protein
MQEVVNVGAADKGITVESINARYIPKVKVNADLPIIVASVAIGSFAFNVILALLVVWAIIRKIQADAEAKLERGLAKIILYAGATWPGSIKTDPRFKAIQAMKKPRAVVRWTGDKDDAADGDDDDDDDDTRQTKPPRLTNEFSQDLPDEENPVANESPDVDLLCPSPRLADAIVSHMDKEDNLGVKECETNYDEFAEWATKVNLDKTEIDLVWKELDRNKSGKVDKKEWDEFIQRRKKLRWLIGTMKSVRKMSRSAPPNGRY